MICHWEVGVLTAPRPQPTLDRTLASLRRAGWSQVRVWRDAGPRAGRGAFHPWLERLEFLLKKGPRADAYFLVEDDVVFCQGLRAYLERALWPDDASQIALCSVFTPEAYQVAQTGWHQESRDFHLVAAQAWIMPPTAARAALADLAGARWPYAADRVVGEWAAKTKRGVWYHTPSLAQHIGVGNSALGDRLVSPLRTAADFIGEWAEPGKPKAESRKRKAES
jgi:hypothetical protein